MFEGIGKLPGGKYHIELKPDAQPVQHPPRAVPEKKKEAYKNELERLCSLGIIELVAGHTDWINSCWKTRWIDSTLSRSKGTSTTPRRLTKLVLNSMTRGISQSLTPSRDIGWWNWIPRAHF